MRPTFSRAGSYTGPVKSIGGGKVDVYLDLVVLLNFLVDLLLILGTNRLSGYPAQWKRAAPAALLGAVYAAACLLPGWRFLGNTLWRLASLALMSVVAFGWSKSTLRRGTLFIFLSMALGGIALGLGNGGFWAIILAAVGVALLCLIGFCGRVTQQQYADVFIQHGNRQLRLTALMDTGNTLSDPVTGCQVLVADADAALKLLDLSEYDLAHPVDTMGKMRNRGLRLIPYHAVGQPAGLLLGIRVDNLQINGKTQNMILAFAPQIFGKPYQALSGGNVG